MSEDLVKVEIRESDLQLVVTEKTLGSLTTNAKQIREIVMAGLQRYDIANYDESNIDLAKKDKAMLNNAAKVLNSKRLEIEKEWMKPFGDFKDVVSDTVRLISECSAKIDTVVRQSDEIEKRKKRAEIEKYWTNTTSYIPDLVKFERIFKPDWLNKTKKIKDVFKELDTTQESIINDLTTLETFDDSDLLKSLYLDTLNINSTIQYANTLKQNRERAKAAEEAKRKAEEEAKSKTASVSPGLPFDNIPYAEEVKEILPEKPEEPQLQMLTRAFRVTTTRENIIALGDFMNEKGIDFQKIEL